ncbi:hypothetical protein [Wenzhouxiangella limi]|uniref:Glycosyltransferase 2-like domain-containing protein n=1 Tax=Wenzhouxiangella limi TaxID=2707351 RepID=A0A845V522_9GAMM|nr:hypothetical protein [Wenzhouxiangella limi]NDY96286.1 hypothetical protein [Wenzhouxiangella limi]
MKSNMESIAQLKAANESFNAKLYRKALGEYNQLAKKWPRLERVLEVNAEICRRRIARSESIANANSCPQQALPSELDALFRLPVNLQFQNSPKVSDDIIIAFLDECGSLAPSVAHLQRALQCAISSPFQRDLLFYANYISEQLDVNPEVYADFENEIPSIGFMVALASRHSFWLLNRAKYLRFLDRVEVASPRARLLYSHRPIPDEQYGQMLPLLGAAAEPASIWSSALPNASARRVTSVNSLHAGTIVLNEEHYIGLNLLQHYNYVDSWTIVEGLCKGYPERKVRLNGLSGDRTSLMVRLFPDYAEKIRYVAHGRTKADGEDAKSELRNRYLDNASASFLLVIDADEFYEPEFIESIKIALAGSEYLSVTVPQVHFWKDLNNFVTGGYYDVSHTRFFRYLPGMMYLRNHNWPEVNGFFLVDERRKKLNRLISEIADGDSFVFEGPYCVHMGFAKPADDMLDKTEYYVNRGEERTRPETTQCRQAWFSNDLPENCTVRRWGGKIPKALTLRNRETA